MHSEYDFNLYHFKSHWLYWRIAAIVIFIFYSGYILFAGYLGDYLLEPDVYLLFPSLAFSAIVFSKYSQWHSTGDFMFILGWLYFLGSALWLLFEEAVVYA